MTGFNFSITSKTLLNKDIIATINDAVKGFEKKKDAVTICDKAVHFKIPNILRITS